MAVAEAHDGKGRTTLMLAVWFGGGAMCPHLLGASTAGDMAAGEFDRPGDNAPSAAVSERGANWGGRRGGAAAHGVSGSNICCSLRHRMLFDSIINKGSK